MNAIKREIIKTQSSPDAVKFIVIDNITYGFGSILSAKEMKALMKSLKELKDRFGLTILLIGHCIKRKSGGPVTLDDLGGSKMIANFSDSAFAINNTALGDEVKYLKLLKSRVVQKPKKIQIVEISQEPYGSSQKNRRANPRFCILPICYRQEALSSQKWSQLSCKCARLVLR